MKILLATDASEHSLRAARYLAQHARLCAEGSEVHVLHVHPPLPYPGAAAAIGKAAVDRYQSEESLAVLEATKKELGAAAVAMRASWRVGDAAQEIDDYVTRNAIDTVVMGTHGHGAVGSLVLGSVAQKVIARVKVPVLVVR
jgi:nucleotide-binding universal stress UspA family protein